MCFKFLQCIPTLKNQKDRCRVKISCEPIWMNVRTLGQHSCQSCAWEALALYLSDQFSKGCIWLYRYLSLSLCPSYRLPEERQETMSSPCPRFVLWHAALTQEASGGKRTNETHRDPTSSSVMQSFRSPDWFSGDLGYTERKGSPAAVFNLRAQPSCAGTLPSGKEGVEP